MALKKLFFALNLNEKIKSELKKHCQEISELFPDRVGERVLKWNSQENLHITLNFLGDRKEEDIPDIIERARKISFLFSKINLQIKKINYFPNEGEAREAKMIWAYLANDKNLSFLMESLGVQTKIIPHITLARIKSWAFKQIDEEEIPNISRETNLSVSCSTFELMGSSLKKTGPEYQILDSLPFGLL